MLKVKEYKEESVDEGKIIWNSEKVKNLLQAMEEGYTPSDHPFYEGDPNYKKGNIVFDYTDWEFAELKKCAKDIIHFANLYCQVMTDEGYQKITLRPYQERVLRSYQANRWNIFLAPRQIGKCQIYTTKIKIRDTNTGEVKETTIGDLYYSKVKPSIIGKIKMFLYKLVVRLESKLV